MGYTRKYAENSNRMLKKRTEYVKVFANRESFIRIITALWIKRDES